MTAAHLAHAVFECIDFAQERGDFLIELLPVLADPDRAAGAQEEVEPCLIFDGLHGLAQCRLGDVQFCCGMCDVLKPADDQEIAHLLNRHGIISYQTLCCGCDTIVPHLCRKTNRFNRWIYRIYPFFKSPSPCHNKDVKRKEL